MIKCYKKIKNCKKKKRILYIYWKIIYLSKSRNDDITKIRADNEKQRTLLKLINDILSKKMD